MKALENKREELGETDYKISDILPCVKERLEKGAEEGRRNTYTWQLASYFCRKGVSLEGCLKVMREWHAHIDKGLDAFPLEEMENTVRKTYSKGGYPLGCFSEYVEGLCVGRESCPIFAPRSVISEESMQKADDVLTNDPLGFITKAAQQEHVGDPELIQIEYISALSARIVKRKWQINIWAIGSSQKGKSHSMDAVAKVLPREYYEVFTSASGKSLFYYCKKYGDNALDKKLIFIDEVEASKDAIPLLRTLTSQTDIEPRHLSVFDAELLDLKIKGK